MQVCNLRATLPCVPNQQWMSAAQGCKDITVTSAFALPTVVTVALRFVGKGGQASLLDVKHLWLPRSRFIPGSQKRNHRVYDSMTAKSLHLCSRQLSPPGLWQLWPGSTGHLWHPRSEELLLPLKSKQIDTFSKASLETAGQ